MRDFQEQCTCTFFLSVNVFSAKVLIGDTILTSPNGDGTAILRGHPSHAKVSPLAVQRKYLHFSVILRPWVMVRPRESNPRPPALQSNALPTELILPRLNVKMCSIQCCVRPYFLQTMLLLYCPINANIRADDSQSYMRIFFRLWLKYKLLPNTPIREKTGSCMEARPKGPSAFAAPGGKNKWLWKKVSRWSK